MTDGWKAAKRKIVSGSGAGYKTKCSNKTCTIQLGACINYDVMMTSTC